MRQPLVAGNWKMHGSRAENARLIEGLAEHFPTTPVACVVCPPHVYLSEVGRMLQAAELPIALGAQDVSAEIKGAFTGEVSVRPKEKMTIWLRANLKRHAAAWCRSCASASAWPSAGKAARYR